MSNNITDLPVNKVKPSEITIEWPNGSKDNLLEALSRSNNTLKMLDMIDGMFTDKDNKEVSLAEILDLIELNDLSLQDYIGPYKG